MEEFYYSNIIVYGFHGCHKDVKNDLLSRNIDFEPSLKEYDWLGEGIYFWENDPFRAFAWANYKFQDDAAVIGAKIQLGSCFDISNMYARQILKEAYEDFKFLCNTSGTLMPVNKSPNNHSGNPEDRVLRFLDKKVVDHSFVLLKEEYPTTVFDTVRAPFQEGFELYPGSGFREHDHIHLCVRNSKSIIELFEWNG